VLGQLVEQRANLRTVVGLAAGPHGWSRNQPLAARRVAGPRFDRPL